MVVNGEAFGEQRRDRLSSLHDDILIRIISLLPLRLAIDTGLLSRRWSGLWRYLTSFDISTLKLQHLQILNQITSPYIYSFSTDISYLITNSNWQDSWLRQICERNVHVLKLTWVTSFRLPELKFPSFIFQTHSLVSLNLGSNYDWYLPDDGVPINLPNLKDLKLDFSHSYGWLENTINALPSLEELTLRLFDQFGNRPEPYIKCSNKNLRRLSIDLSSFKRSKVVINAPELEYLDVVAPKTATLCFEVEPIVLREAKIGIIKNTNRVEVISNEENRLMSIFYGGLSNVKFLTLDAFVLDNISTVFHNVISLTLCMKKVPANIIKTLFSILELFPQLDILNLKFLSTWQKYEHNGIFPEPSHVNPIRRVIKQIDIDIVWHGNEMPTKSFLFVLHCLLSNARVLKRFRLRVDGSEQDWNPIEYKRRNELEFCKLLKQYQIVSTWCEVEFIGRYLDMSYKAGSNVGREISEVITFK